MIRHHETDLVIAHDVIADRIQQAAHARRVREARPRPRRAGPLRPVGRLFVRLGIALGGGPEAPAAPTLSPVRPR
jgi:hypothetical protein